MLVTRQKRKERKEFEIRLNNTPLLKVYSLKNLGIIFENKLTFRRHIKYTDDKCTNIFTL